jgi:hypothetical protein
MHTLVYVIWISIPLVMTCLILWDAVDNIVKGRKNKHFFAQLRQTLFVVVAICCCIVLDMFVLDFLVGLPLVDIIGRDLLLVLLLPAVLLIGALAIGPSKPILIADAPKLSNRRQNVD